MSSAAGSAPAPRARRPAGGRPSLAAAGLVALLVLAPVAALAMIAAQGSGDLWPHLAAYVLPAAITDTALLMAGVGLLTVAIGAPAAWLVTAYDFPGRRVAVWALLMPLAVPTYIVAFAYLDILHPIGPVQSALRAVLGREFMRAHRLPDLRSLWGAVLVIGFVLYPYVYLPARAMFLMQAANMVEAARLLGAGPFALFFRVALPQARPALAVGAALALMETMNDIGASEFLGVQTLTVSIYSTWVNRASLPGAAQIALAALAVVVGLVALERYARRRQSHAAGAQRSRRLSRRRLSGARGWAAAVAVFLPPTIGFAVPALYLGHEAFVRIRFSGISGDLVREAGNTVMVAGLATVATLALGLVVAHAARSTRGAAAGLMLRVASLGYAVPGTVLAIGLMLPLAALDRAAGLLAETFAGVTTGLIFSGSLFAILYAYVARFLAIAAGGIDAGFARLPVSLDHAARTLGASGRTTLMRIHLPLITPALASAALLVFVDCMKELPATLLLRPMNFETLATHLYGEAARGTYEEGAIAAMAIIAFGLMPVIWLARLGEDGPAHRPAREAPAAEPSPAAVSLP